MDKNEKNAALKTEQTPVKGVDKFKTNFGFLMAAVGSAVGLGNIWGFPFKMGKGGGFAFLLIYLILVVLVGYPILLGEISLGRKSGKGAIFAYREADRRFTFNGWFAALAPVFLICFYVTLGGYVTKYMVANLMDLLGLGWGVGGMESGEFFGSFTGSGAEAVLFGFFFLALTTFIVLHGTSGIEKFATTAMPALYVILIILAIRSLTLPGAMKGVEYMFKPNWEVFKGTGWISVLASAGGQMFFSLSLSSGCMISYGSYLDKKEDLEKNAKLIPLYDTSAALLAALVVLPAVFAYGLEPGGGPGLLFVTLQTVFNKMGVWGSLFGFVFYFLVFIAALTSSMGMMEGTVSPMKDLMEAKGKSLGRTGITLIFTAIAAAGSALISLDALGGNPAIKHIFGFGDWLTTFDLFAEGFLMPLGAFFLAILFGWLKTGWLDEEIQLGSEFKNRAFIHFTLKWIVPIFMVFVLIGQLNDFFAWGLF